MDYDSIVFSLEEFLALYSQKENSRMQTILPSYQILYKQANYDSPKWGSCERSTS